MGIRQTQPYGLSERARAEVTRLGLLPLVRSDAHIEGMFGEPVPLYAYIDLDPTLGELTEAVAQAEQVADAARGRLEVELRTRTPRLLEVEQTIEWSSGPCIFTTLETPTGQRQADLDWTEPEIAAELGYGDDDPLTDDQDDLIGVSLSVMDV